MTDLPTRSPARRVLHPPAAVPARVRRASAAVILALRTDPETLESPETPEARPADTDADADAGAPATTGRPPPSGVARPDTQRRLAGSRVAAGPADPATSAETLSPPAAGQGRRTVSWRRCLAAGLVCFAVWLLLDAPTLQRSAQASPLGARRTVALAILRPIAGTSSALGFGHLVGGVDRVLGRTGHGVVKVAGAPLRVPPRRHPVATSIPAHTVGSAALPPLAPPSAADPLRVLAVGDSIGVDLGDALVNELAQTPNVTGIMDARVDTGLARPDYFDWPARLHSDLAADQPQVVVVFLGANDPQNFVDGGTAVAFGTQDWNAAYSRRVGAFMSEATSAGARVLWIGLPPMADPVLNAKMQTLNAIYQEQAASHPGVTYFPSWGVLSDAGGGFATYLADASGAQVAVRTPDGTHLTPAGSTRLAQAAIGTMDQQWGLHLQP